MSFSKEEQSLRGRIGGYTTASRYDTRSINTKARKTFRDSFDQRARDEAKARGEKITEAEAKRRGSMLYHLHFVRMSFLAAKDGEQAREAEALGPG